LARIRRRAAIAFPGYRKSGTRVRFAARALSWTPRQRERIDGRAVASALLNIGSNALAYLATRTSVRPHLRLEV